MSTLNEQQLLTCAKQMESLKRVLTCKICLAKPTSARLCNDCCAVFCFECIKNWMDNNKRTCPTCSRSKSLDDFVNLLWAEDLTKNWDKEPCIEGEIVPAYDATEFTLRDFSNRRVRDDIAYSDTLRSGGLEWKLSVASNGNGDTKGTFLSVFLELVSGTDRPVKVQFRIRMINRKSTDPGSNKVHDSMDVFETGQAKGPHEFFRLDRLESDGFLVQDSLQFKFEVRPVTTSEGYYELKSRIEDASNELVNASDTTDFIINGFSKSRDRSDSLYSNALQSAGLTWKLNVDTNGYGEAKGKFLSVYLKLMSGLKGSSKFHFTIEMLNRKSRETGRSRVFEDVDEFSNGVAYGVPTFFPLSRLECDGFLVQDTLHFKFSVKPTTLSDLIRLLQHHNKSLQR